MARFKLGSQLSGANTLPTVLQHLPNFCPQFLFNITQSCTKITSLYIVIFKRAERKYRITINVPCQQCDQIWKKFHNTLEKKLNVFGYFSESLFSIWQNFEPSLVTLPFVCYSADLYYKKLPNIYKSSSHLVTLPAKKSNKKLR